MTRIQDMHQKIRQDRLLKRRLESLHEAVWQVPHKSNRVSQQQSLASRKFHASSRGVQSRKELIFDEYLRTGQFFQQSRFACVGVTDDRTIRKGQTHPLFSLSRPS